MKGDEPMCEKGKVGGCGHVTATEFLEDPANKEIKEKVLGEFNARIDELLAKCAHDIWSHWMRYMFKVGGDHTMVEVLMSDGEVEPLDCWVMFRDEEIRWRRQMETSYEDLDDKEKISDREIAEKFIKPVIREILSPPRIPL